MVDIRAIKMRDGVEISCKIKEMGGPIWLVATHGIGEHLERHQYLSDIFGQYFNIFRYDLRGHGRSGGPRGDIDAFSQYMEDLSELIQFLHQEYRMKRYVLFGHSMGALITASYLQNFHKTEYYPERVFLSAPPAAYVGLLGKFIEYAPPGLFRKIEQSALGLKLRGLVDLQYLSHDPRVREAYLADPLNELALHTRLLFGMAAAAKDVFARPIRPKCPAMCVVGSEDQIVNPHFLKKYFANVDRSFDFQIIKGGYHELHNEIEKYRRVYFELLRNFLMDCLYRE
ncbi:MAG: alpha/beta fold hydrolase [Bdellovibrio sp.]|nr:alpha/beta fold hydrolase [Bdellovibrio sp.]